MDLRTKKTEKNITDAFIKLRCIKPIEKITIKELAKEAYINKATFYRHYEDIYALSDSIENKIISDCLSNISDTNILLSTEGLKILEQSFNSQKDLFNVIFSGSRKDAAIHKFHDKLLDKIFSQYPGFDISSEKKAILTTLIYGMFQAYQVHEDVTFDTISTCLLKLSKSLY